MSDLLIDIGNTHFKWCAWNKADGCGEIESVSLPYVNAVMLSRLFTAGRWKKIWIANVAGKPFEQRILTVANECAHIPLHFVRAEADAFGLKNGYQWPERLGIDRWLALIAARRLASEAFYLVDAGSAITIDYVDASGFHQGGIIAPGFRNMLNALIEKTSLDTGACEKPDQLQLARDTTLAICSGCASSLVGLVNLHVPVAARLILTGGDARWLAGKLQRDCEIVPDLVFQGLAQYAKVV